MLSKAETDFLACVLGSTGSSALIKAMSREPMLKDTLLPRTILSWLDFVVPLSYQGEIPGQEGTHCEFRKSEQGYTGAVLVNNKTLEFSGASPYHLAATFAAALGSTPTGEIDQDVARKLGDAIDKLVKAQVLIGELNKRILDPGAGYNITHEHHDLGDGEKVTKLAVHHGDKYVGGALFTHKGDELFPDGVQVDPAHRRRGVASAMYAYAERATGKRITPSYDQTPMGAALWAGNKDQKQFGKIELPGTAHAAQKAVAPIGAVPPKVGVPSAKKPKLAPMTIGKSESLRICPVCKQSQFHGNRLVGCSCFAELAKHSKTTTYGDGYAVDWDETVTAEQVLIYQDFFGG